MADASAERSAGTSRPGLDAGLVITWLVIGAALVATAVVAFGWRRVIAIWLASGLMLAVIIVADAWRSEPDSEHSLDLGM